MPRPERTVLDAFAAGLEARLDRANPPGAHPDAPALHRLNRTEYANAIRDLLAIDVDVKALLPSDDSNEGFDNLAEALTVSPSLVQGYVAAAMKISRQAVGDRSVAPSQVTYSAPGRQTHDKHIEGLPLGTRGGLLVNHLFPLDAEYEFSVGGAGGGGGLGGSALDVTHRRRADHGAEPAQLPPDRQRRAARHRPRARRSAARRRRGRGLLGLPRGLGVHASGRRPDRDHHRPLQPDRHRHDPEPAEGVRVPSGGARRGNAVRAPHRLDAGAPRVPPAADAGRRGHADGVLSRRARGRRLRDRHPARAGPHPGRAQVRVPHRAGAGGAGRRTHLRHQRPRARVAAVVLPLELDSRRSAARPGRARPPLEPHRARAAGRADAEGPEVRCARPQLLPGSGSTCASSPTCSRRRGASTTTCARRSAAKPSCSSTASCARTGRSRRCSTPTTPSWTNGSPGTTASRTSTAATSAGSRWHPTARAAGCSGRAAC